MTVSPVRWIALLDVTLLVLLALGACEDQEPSNPAPSLVRVDAEPAGRHCPEGGRAVHVGLDDDGDDALDDDEIDSTTYVCDADALIRDSDELAGPNCAAGGTAIHAGSDRNGNGALDDDEITSTTYVCNDELAPLVTRLDDEPAGANCATGGTAVRAGLDLDGNHSLDDAEVLRVDYVCDETLLVRVDEEAPGPNCASGGAALRSGADIDGDEVLDDAEITHTEYACDGIVVGDLEISSWTDFAALAEITVVTGDVRTVGLLSGVTSIPLPALRVIGGNLSIRSSDSMSSLSLPALEMVAGLIRIEYNDALTNIALPGLRAAGSIDIYQNSALTALDLGALEQIPGRLTVWRNPIGDIDLGALNYAGRISLWDLAATTIGLPKLSIVEDLSVAWSTLTSFSAPQLYLVEKDLVFGFNPSLLSLSFPSLTAIGGALIIRDQGAMTSFALPALTDLGDKLGVWSNPSLTGFSLPLLRTIGTWLEIVDNDALLNLDGLAGLETVTYNFTFLGNASVRDLSGLTKLRRVGLGGQFFELNIKRSALQRLGLPNLVEVQNLKIGDAVTGNPELETLDLPRLRHARTIWLIEAPAATRFDLPELDAVWAVLGIAFSPSMPTCRADALLAQLAVVPEVAISGTNDGATCD